MTEPTIRAHLEAIRDGVQTSATNRAVLRRETELLEHAVAALALLDNAATYPRVGTPQENDRSHVLRLVPDPGSAATHKETA